MNNASGTDRLNKLFKQEPFKEVSLKYTAPKAPGADSVPESKVKSPVEKVQLKVITGKTVDAFKVLQDQYIGQGKVGIALLGNDDVCHYQLYMYRGDQTNLTSAVVTSEFRFLVHQNHYASFMDTTNTTWSIRFATEEDLSSFCKEIALARWSTSQGQSQILIQDLAPGDQSRKVDLHDTVKVQYSAYSLSTKRQLSKLVKSMIVEKSVSSDDWERNVNDALVKSKCFIILPYKNLGHWKDVAPVNGDLCLEMDLIDVVATNKQPPSKSNVTLKKNQNVRKASPLDSIKLVGHPVLCFPDLFPQNQDPLDASEDKELDPDESNHDDKEMPDLPRVHQEEIPFPSMNTGIFSPSPALPSKIPDRKTTKSSISMDSHMSYERTVPSRPYYMSEDPFSLSGGNINSQFNMLLSEVRTTNSELRMNITRVADKLDTLLMDRTDIAVNSKLNQTTENIQFLVDLNKNMNCTLEDKLAMLLEQNKSILNTLDSNRELLLVKAETVSPEVKTGNDTKQSSQSHFELQDQCKSCQVLNEEKTALQELYQKALERNSNLESTMESLEARLLSVEDKKTQLESQNISFQHQILELGRKINDLDLNSSSLKHDITIKEQHFQSELKLKDQKILFLEGMLDQMQNKLQGEKSLKNIEVSAAVKKAMNMAFKALKVELVKSPEDSKVHDLVASVMRGVTTEFLERYGDDSQPISKTEVSDKPLSSGIASSSDSANSIKTSIPPPVKPRQKAGLIILSDSGSISHQTELVSSQSADESKYFGSGKEASINCLEELKADAASSKTFSWEDESASNSSSNSTKNQSEPEILSSTTDNVAPAPVEIDFSNSDESVPVDISQVSNDALLQPSNSSIASDQNSSVTNEGQSEELNSNTTASPIFIPLLNPDPPPLPVNSQSPSSLCSGSPSKNETFTTFPAEYSAKKESTAWQCEPPPFFDDQEDDQWYTE